ncbi:MAG: LamG domain-containing protein, partial [Candidatus Sumerlaeia bacterium]|nr:LamG domain-containing protein [Candidatus Sumerlaeia bacterium]
MTPMNSHRQYLADVFLVLGLCASLMALAPSGVSADDPGFTPDEIEHPVILVPEEVPVEEDDLLELAPVDTSINLKSDPIYFPDKSSHCDFDPLFLTGPNVLHDISTGFSGAQISYVVGNVTGYFITGLEVEAGGEYVTAIQFGAGTSTQRGYPVSVTLLSNPDAEFNPATATLIHHEHGFVDSVSGWTTVEFREPVYIGPPGTKFFAGAVVRQEYNSQSPIRVANTSETGTRSWDRGVFGSDMNVSAPPNIARPSGTIYPIRAIGRSTAQVDCLRIARMDTCDIPCTSTVVQGVNKARPYIYALHRPFIYNVRFSGPVTGVTADAFTLSTTGTLTGYDISLVSGSGANYQVEINRAGGFGTGELTLTKGDLSSVLDQFGEPVGDFFPRVEPYLVNHQATRLISSNVITDPEPKLQFTFSSPIIERPDISLTFQNYFDVTNPTIEEGVIVGTSPYGSALSVDSSSVNGTAVAPTAEYFPNDEYTIEGWIYTNSIVADAPIIDFRNGTGDRVIFALGGAGNRYLIFESINSSSTPTVRRAFTWLPIALENWVHVAASVKDGRVDLYINGTRHGSAGIEALNSGLMNDNNIGQRLTVANARFDGAIDNLRIWSRALDAVEISEAMSEVAYPTTTSDLVAQWNFDEGTGLVAADSSGNGHDITLLPDAGWVDSGVPFSDTIEISFSDIVTPSYFRARPTLTANTGIPNYFGLSFEGFDPAMTFFTFPNPVHTGSTTATITTITRLNDEFTNATSLPFEVGANDILVEVPTDDFLPTLTGDLGTATVSSTSFRTTDSIWLSGLAGSHVRVPNLMASIPNEEITIEFWQRAMQLTNQEIFTSPADTNENRILAHTPWSNNIVYWDFGNIFTTGRLQYTPPESLIKEWNHFAFVASTSGNFMRIYRNGVLEAEKFEADGYTNQIGDHLIGSNGTSQMQVLVQEYRIWNRALDGEEIRDLRFSTPDTSDPDLFLYFSFNEFEDLGIGGAGLDIRDLSLNENHGHVASPNSATVLTPSSAPFRVMVEQPDGDVG